MDTTVYTASAAVLRAGPMAASCSSRRPTPTPCCRRASGAATGLQQSRRRRPGPIHVGGNAAQAALEGDLAGKVQALASDPKDGLAAALARLGQAFMARNA